MSATMGNAHEIQVNEYDNSSIIYFSNSKVYMICRDLYLSRLVGKPTMRFPNRSDTNRSVQAQKGVRSLEFRIKVEEELY